MSKYFKVFKFCEDNIVKSLLCTYKDESLYIYSAKVFLEAPLNTCYDFRVRDLCIGSGWCFKDYYPYINFYKHNFDFRDLKGSWCSIILNDIAPESESAVLEELYNELGNLENPEEDQIACYTFLINRLTNG